MPNRRTIGKVIALGQQHAANLAGLQSGDGFADGGPTSALRAMLHDFRVFAGRLDEPFSFARIVAAGLFDVDMLAGVHGQDRRRRVPMIGSGDHNRIERLIVQDTPKVADALWGLFLDFRDGIDRFGDIAHIDITDIRHFHAGQRGQPDGQFGSPAIAIIFRAGSADDADDQFFAAARLSWLPARSMPSSVPPGYHMHPDWRQRHDPEICGGLYCPYCVIACCAWSISLAARSKSGAASDVFPDQRSIRQFTLAQKQ